MRNAIRATGLALGLALTAALPVQAQEGEQTKENAQGFIAHVLTQGNATMEYLEEGMPGFNEFKVKREFCNGRTCDGRWEIVWRQHRPFAIAAIDSGVGKSICFTRFVHIGLDMLPVYEGTNVMSRVSQQARTAHDVDWDKVASVEVDASSVIVTGVGPKLRFNLPSEALAKRTGFAMEFLRTECDATGKYGF